MDYWPFGVLALAAIVIGGVSPFAVPLVGLIGIGMLGYHAWLGLRQGHEDRDPERRGGPDQQHDRRP